MSSMSSGADGPRVQTSPEPTGRTPGHQTSDRDQSVAPLNRRETLTLRAVLSRTRREHGPGVAERLTAIYLGVLAVLGFPEPAAVFSLLRH